MPCAAPRIPPLLRAVIRGAEPGGSYADLCRQVGAVADAFALTRPSYQQVRVIAVAERLRRAEATAVVLALGAVRLPGRRVGPPPRRPASIRNRLLLAGFRAPTGRALLQEGLQAFLALGGGPVRGDPLRRLASR